MFPEGRKTGREQRTTRKIPRLPARRSNPISEGQAPAATSRRFSAVAGGILIAVAALWFLWLLVRQVNPGVVSLRLPFSPNAQPTRSANAPVDPLAVAGITLSAPPQGQQPGLTQQQAVLVAGQAEPQAAAKAAGFDARYTLLSYQAITSGSGGFHNVPVWLIHYRGISEPRPDTAADPQATGTMHNFYVFLEASSGRELLAIWL
ncbi:MAG TPA: hypothetical protein VGF67_02355 [Ktedonobacteraceae bacterium]|jgi:hypothetical protein